MLEAEIDLDDDARHGAGSMGGGRDAHVIYGVLGRVQMDCFFDTGDRVLICLPSMDFMFWLSSADLEIFKAGPPPASGSGRADGANSRPIRRTEYGGFLLP